jgi:hypothetical protein
VLFVVDVDVLIATMDFFHDASYLGDGVLEPIENGLPRAQPRVTLDRKHRYPALTTQGLNLRTNSRTYVWPPYMSELIRKGNDYGTQDRKSGNAVRPGFA